MIGKVSRWQDTAELVRFLYGPGDLERHDNPRLIAGDRREPYLSPLEPALRTNGSRDFRPLTAFLTLPFAVLNVAATDRPVWHCLLQAAQQDRLLTDVEWAEAARDVMTRTGLAAPGDDDGVRWITVRHGADHVHLVATLARQDGARVDVWRDYFKVRAACQTIEDRYGLRRTGRTRQGALAAS